MGIEIITDDRAVEKLLVVCLTMKDARAKWIAKKKPEVARRIIGTALGFLPDDKPAFSAPSEVQAFTEGVQFETILQLRDNELAVGLTLEIVSQTRWQWVTERAIGEIVQVVVDRYLK